MMLVFVLRDDKLRKTELKRQKLRHQPSSSENNSLCPLSKKVALDCPSYRDLLALICGAPDVLENKPKHGDNLGN